MREDSGFFLFVGSTAVSASLLSTLLFSNAEYADSEIIAVFPTIPS
jgi:hypothetical protein